MENKLDQSSSLLFLEDDIAVTKKVQLLGELDFQNIQTLNESYLFLEKKFLSGPKTFDCIDGTIYKSLLRSGNIDICNRLHDNFSNGLVDPNSPFHSYYLDLQALLVDNNFQEADKLTSKILCKFVDITNRGWLYFSDVKQIPESELKLLDNLWKTYSQGKFGFSVQRQIWLKNGKDWNSLWDKIGWRENEVLCRYPDGFIWDIRAPIGHLPLSNQLRGIQTLKALFNLTVWI